MVTWVSQKAPPPHGKSMGLTYDMLKKWRCSRFNCKPIITNVLYQYLFMCSRLLKYQNLGCTKQANSSKGSTVPGFHANFEKLVSLMRQSQKQALLFGGIRKNRLGMAGISV